MANRKTATKKLLRSSKDKTIAGVCGGLGEYFGLDPLIFKLFFVFITLFGGSGILLYIIFWILMPSK